MKPKPWDRKLWGVACGALLIGSFWDDGIAARGTYPGEPRRPLLFHTRKECRAWIARQEPFHYRPVRVRERVEVL